MVCAGLGAEIPGEEDAKNKGENRREKNKKSGTSLVPPKIKPDLPVESMDLKLHAYGLAAACLWTCSCMPMDLQLHAYRLAAACFRRPSSVWVSRV